MPKLAIFGESKSDCAALMALFSKHLKENNIGQVFDNAFKGSLGSAMKYLDQQMMEPENANWSVFAIQIGQLDKLALTPEQLMRKYCIDKALIIWHQSNRSKKCQNCTKIPFPGKGLTECLLRLQNGTSSESMLEIPAKKIKYHANSRAEQWAKFFQCWPIEVWPIFVKYEELFVELQSDSDLSARFIAIAELVGMDTAQFYETKCIENVANSFDASSLTSSSSTRCKTPPTLFRHALLSRAKLPPRLAHLLPDPDPRIHSRNYSHVIHVVEPYIPLRAIQNVNDALLSKQVSSAGTWPKQLAAKLCTIYSFPVAVPCSNGFTSLLLALRSANIGYGADVLMPSLTFVAVANAVLNAGANPIFVDSTDDESDYNPSWSLLLRAATLKTRAVIITHTYGCPAVDIELIAAGCKKHGWTLIEDISECVGITALTSAGDERLLGTFADYTCASLNSNKIVHAGDGGFVLARDPSVGVHLQSLANHGHTKSLQFVHFQTAINGKINGLGAALACGVLDQLREIIAHRHLVSAWYRAGLSPLFAKRLLAQMPRCGHRDTPWLCCVLCRSSTERSALRAHLAMNGIETRNMFFPLHLQPMFDAEYVHLDLPVAERLASTGLALPTHPGLDKHQIELIVTEIGQFFGEQLYDKAI